MVLVGSLMGVRKEANCCWFVGWVVDWYGGVKRRV